MIRFQPIYQMRVWGGRELETSFKRKLPNQEEPFGESWEISARSEADSIVISEGTWHGRTLTDLWNDSSSRSEIFGANAPQGDRFPLLCKILDARNRLSIQVHPPAKIAAEMGGEPKSETWFIAKADPGAEIYVGVKSGVTRSNFEAALKDGTVDDCVHRIPVSAGEHIFIPSVRLHAIGAGLVIYEIQQNSDTTYRVFDWNRVGMNGKPRDLHIEESLRCIDFEDVEPSMDSAVGTLICKCDYFRMEQHSIKNLEEFNAAISNRFAIITVVSGAIGDCTKGDFFIAPAGSPLSEISADAKILLTTWPAVA